MAASITIVRLILALLAAGLAYFLGRSCVRLRRGRARRSQTYAWAFRTILALGGVLWASRSDAVAVGSIVLACVTFVLGAYLEGRPKREEEDLTDIMFPKA